MDQDQLIDRNEQMFVDVIDMNVLYWLLMTFQRRCQRGKIIQLLDLKWMTIDERSWIWKL